MQIGSDRGLSPSLPPEVAAEIALDAAEKTAYVGDTFRLAATVKNTDDAVSWYSSNAEVAAVSTDGTVTVFSVGTANISAVVGGAQAKCVVTAVNSPYPLLEVSLASSVVYLGYPRTVSASVSLNGQNTEADVTYAVDDETIAAVDEDGVITGKAEGKTTVRVNAAVNGTQLSRTPEFTPSGVVGQTDPVAFEVTSNNADIAEVIKNQTTQAPEKLMFKDAGEVTITIRFFVTGSARVGEAVKTVTKTVEVVGVSFASTAKQTLAVGEKSTREAIVTPDTYDALYSVKDGSSDVITVDQTTGEVTAVAVGTKTVVVTVQGGATAEYEVEVKALSLTCSARKYACMG